MAILANKIGHFSIALMRLFIAPAIKIKLPPAKPEVYCWGASKALVNQEPPKGG
jgi:hypothetical protein